MIEIQETYQDCLRIVIAEACVADANTNISSSEEPNDALRKILNESKAVEVTERSAHYEIIFDDYLEWDVNELPELADMSPQRSLHIMRIVQEAVTNVIKHANSSKVTLSTVVEDGERRNIYINVTDYGDGANVTGGRQGRGVDNMKYRAEQIGGELRFSSSSQGTTVSLILSY